MSCCRSQRGGFAWHRRSQCMQCLSAIDSTAAGLRGAGCRWCFWKLEAVEQSPRRRSKRHAARESMRQASRKARKRPPLLQRCASRPTWCAFRTLSVARALAGNRASAAAFGLVWSATSRRRRLLSLAARTSRLALAPSNNLSSCTQHHHHPYPNRHDCFLVSLLLAIDLF